MFHFEGGVYLVVVVSISNSESLLNHSLICRMSSEGLLVTPEYWNAGM